MTRSFIPPIKYCRPIRYFDGLQDLNPEVQQTTRYYTYEIEAGLVAGVCFDIMIRFDRSRQAVWPYVKDLNWMNRFGNYFSGAIGDLEGETYGLSAEATGSPPHHYAVLRVIPEHLTVTYQPIFPESEGPTYLPGLGSAGAVSPGFHVVMLSGNGNTTHFVTYMDHAALMTRDAKQMTDEQALAPWRELAPAWHRRWRDDFIPYLKQLVRADKELTS